MVEPRFTLRSPGPRNRTHSLDFSPTFRGILSLSISDIWASHPVHVGCLTAFLASAHWMPIVPLHTHPRQPKMSPDVGNVTWGQNLPTNLLLTEQLRQVAGLGITALPSKTVGVGGLCSVTYWGAGSNFIYVDFNTQSMCI